jgi:hypothetical protein
MAPRASREGIRRITERDDRGRFDHAVYQPRNSYEAGLAFSGEAADLRKLADAAVTEETRDMLLKQAKMCERIVEAAERDRLPISPNELRSMVSRLMGDPTIRRWAPLETSRRT